MKRVTPNDQFLDTEFDADIAVPLNPTSHARLAASNPANAVLAALEPALDALEQALLIELTGQLERTAGASVERTKADLLSPRTAIGNGNNQYTQNNPTLERSETKLGGANIWRDPNVTSPDAVERTLKFASVVSPKHLESLSVRAIHVYDAPEDVPDAIIALVKGAVDVPDEAQGVFDRKTRTIIATLSPMGSYTDSGAVLYHEIGHASEHLITDPAWEDPWREEWSGHDQDEGFAHAFSDYHVAKYETEHDLIDGKPRKEGEETMMDEFKRLRPRTYELFTDWKL